MEESIVITKVKNGFVVTPEPSPPKEYARSVFDTYDKLFAHIRSEFGEIYTITMVRDK